MLDRDGRVDVVTSSAPACIPFVYPSARSRSYGYARTSSSFLPSFPGRQRNVETFSSSPISSQDATEPEASSDPPRLPLRGSRTESSRRCCSGILSDSYHFIHRRAVTQESGLGIPKVRLLLPRVRDSLCSPPKMLLLGAGRDGHEP
jgi:hypothetical protein